MHIRKYYRTVVLSDIHLGTSFSKTKEVTSFLKSINCDQLILNGDIIDGWSLQKNAKSKWKSKHTEFIKVLMKMMENFGTQIIYIRGNHDDFLDALVPFELNGIRIVKDYTHLSNGRKYFITHGDIFDAVTTKMRWLAKLGDVGYTFLLWVNKWYNLYRLKRKKPYQSLSQMIKERVKGAVSYISDFETELVRYAKLKKCQGIICGHIHHPENCYYDNIHYLNSGDWVESLSALTEDSFGNWEIFRFSGSLVEESESFIKDKAS